MSFPERQHPQCDLCGFSPWPMFPVTNFRKWGDLWSVADDAVGELATIQSNYTVNAETKGLAMRADDGYSQPWFEFMEKLEIEDEDRDPTTIAALKKLFPESGQECYGPDRMTRTCYFTDITAIQGDFYFITEDPDFELIPYFLNHFTSRGGR